MRSFPAAWTTATRCSSASLKDWWTDCSRFRTPPPVWLLAPDAPTTYRRCSISYTGYRYASASTSRWPHSYTSRCLAFHHRTWPTTAVLSPMLVSGDCVLCTASRFRTYVVTRDIQHLWRQSVRSCRLRTMEQSSVAPERRWQSYSEFRRSLKTSLFGQWAGHGAVWTVLIAPTRNILTYLLTYL